MAYAVEVESLSKKYILRHHDVARYATFRDFLTGSVKQLVRRFASNSNTKAAQNAIEEFWALHNINLNIAPGEKLGIVGRNGAGKSTLLKIVSRITEPTKGRITIRGRVASLLEVGTGFHPELSGRENIFLNGAILGMGKKEIIAKFDEIVEFAGVEKFLDTPVKRYSSGMYVRLAFSVAAHLEPEILIVDEVLAVGDNEFQQKCLGKMDDIGKEGRTILFVSHNMNTVLRFTSRAVLLDAGKIVFDANSEETVREYTKQSAKWKSVFSRRTKNNNINIEEFSITEEKIKSGFNQPLIFKLALDLTRSVNDINIMLAFVNSVGARILTAKAVLSSVSKGHISYELNVESHQLTPGSYQVNLYLGHKGEVIYSGNDGLALELSADGVDEPLLIPHLARGRDKLGVFCPIRIESSQ